MAANDIQGKSQVDTVALADKGITTLWEGDATTGTITLSESITNFDQIVFECSASNWLDSKAHRPSSLLNYNGKYIDVWLSSYESASYVVGRNWTNTTFTITAAGANSSLVGVYGIKY